MWLQQDLVSLKPDVSCSPFKHVYILTDLFYFIFFHVALIILYLKSLSWVVDNDLRKRWHGDNTNTSVATNAGMDRGGQRGYSSAVLIWDKAVRGQKPGNQFSEQQSKQERGKIQNQARNDEANTRKSLRKWTELMVPRTRDNLLRHQASTWT